MIFMWYKFVPHAKSQTKTEFLRHYWNRIIQNLDWNFLASFSCFRIQLICLVVSIVLDKMYPSIFLTDQLTPFIPGLIRYNLKISPCMVYLDGLFQIKLLGNYNYGTKYNQSKCVSEGFPEMFASSKMKQEKHVT